MTLDEVRQRVAEIDDVADLPEQAHMAEDRLYCDVLAAIADGAIEPAELARAALASRDLGLDRYYSPPSR